MLLGECEAGSQPSGWLEPVARCILFLPPILAVNILARLFYSLV